MRDLAASSAKPVVAAVYDRRTGAMKNGGAPAPGAEAEDGGHRPPLQERESESQAIEGLPESESVNVWPDETAEAAFMSEARERGEPVKAAAQVVEEVEDRETAKALPKLDELVEKIPAEARELLEELFRAKFVAVRRVKKSDLKA